MAITSLHASSTWLSRPVPRKAAAGHAFRASRVIIAAKKPDDSFKTPDSQNSVLRVSGPLLAASMLLTVPSMDAYALTSSVTKPVEVASVAELFGRSDPAPLNRDSKASDVSGAGGGGYGTPLSGSRIPEGQVSGDEKTIREARQLLDEQEQTGAASKPGGAAQTNTLLDPYGKEPNKK